MLDGSREVLLKRTKRKQKRAVCQGGAAVAPTVEALQKGSNAKMSVLAQTTTDLRQRSEDVQGAAQQLTSTLRSPNVKGGQWAEVNLRVTVGIRGAGQLLRF